MKFAARRVVIEAIQWNGGSMKPLDDFCDRNWSRADAVGAEYWPSDIADKEQVVIRNQALQAWLPLPVGWWIVRGVQGELTPCSPDTFPIYYAISSGSGRTSESGAAPRK
jgi:hypothetical protein